MKVKSITISDKINDFGNNNPDFNRFLFQALGCFLNKDWGDVLKADAHWNDLTLTSNDGAWIAASYNTELCEEGRVFVFGDKDEEENTWVVSVMFPSEYEEV